MNIFVLISGVLALFTTIGHFTMGRKMYMKPMLNADFDEVPKTIMHSVFHYISVFLVSSSITLLGFGLDVFAQGNNLLILFIALNYAAFAIWQIVIALSSGINKSMKKIFQWVFFVLIALFAFIGVM